jgi:hypothetical protein
MGIIDCPLTLSSRSFVPSFDRLFFDFRILLPKGRNQFITPMGQKKRKDWETDEIEEFRKSLGPIGSRYSRGQLAALLREMDILAEFLLDLYLYKRKDTKENS